MCVESLDDLESQTSKMSEIISEELPTSANLEEKYRRYQRNRLI